MKKKNLSPLELDKETIARLDEKQLDALAGGATDPDEQDEATDRTSIGGCCNTCNQTTVEAEVQ